MKSDMRVRKTEHYESILLFPFKLFLVGNPYGRMCLKVADYHHFQAEWKRTALLYQAANRADSG